MKITKVTFNSLFKRTKEDPLVQPEPLVNPKGFDRDPMRSEKHPATVGNYIDIMDSHAHRGVDPTNTGA
ncbi:hypothetical protein BDB01DRAFT_803364 [Pilobolus umbonatus]|nr:hypothetical protein BDB01DRAFT_803364 [Pilobolus umbonatus]